MRSELKSIMDDQEILKNRLVELVKKQIKEIAMLRFGENDAETVTIGDDWCAYLYEYGDKVYSLNGKGVSFQSGEDIHQIEYEDINYTQVRNLVFDLEQYIDLPRLHVSKK